jgi:hypothetical protein
MNFEYLKFWLRWYWLPYQEKTVTDMTVRWLCFEVRWKIGLTQRAPDRYPRWRNPE